MQLEKLKPRALHWSGHGVTADDIYKEQVLYEKGKTLE
jgi:hypothetical protein